MLRGTVLFVLALAAAGQATCPSGWASFSTNCYKLMPQKVYFTQAKNTCEGATAGSSSLVSIHSAAEQDFVRQLTAGYEYVWIGLNDLVVEGRYVWTDGSATDYQNWAPHQPDNLNDSDCVFLLPDGTWDDGRCAHHPFGTTPPKVFVCMTATT